VLFRAAFHSYDLEVELARVGIPYAKFGGLRFTEMAHLKDVVAHLRVVENPADAMSWHRLLLLVEGVGARTSQRLIRRLSEGMGASAALREFTAECRRSTLVHHLEPLAELFEELARPGQSLRDMVQAVCSYYEPIAVRKFDDFPKRMHDLHFLEDWAEQYATLQAMLTDLALEPPDFQGRKAAHGAAGMLTLSTIHSAKGMEWRVVFLIAAAEGRFPSPYAAYRDEEMEEELRLFYVASTRARERLVITYPRSFRGAWSDGLSGGPSPFLHAIPRECLERKTVERFCL
jgi:DNA helicase-2/ATP-dependent DNA helicase PcrA